MKHTGRDAAVTDNAQNAVLSVVPHTGPMGDRTATPVTPPARGPEDPTPVVAGIIDAIGDLGAVSPSDRVALRLAVARLTLTDSPRAITGDHRIPPWVRIGDVAATLRVTPATVVKMIRTGELVGFQLRDRSGSEWRVTHASWRDYLVRNGAVPPGVTP